jgi:hypothetical protein
MNFSWIIEMLLFDAIDGELSCREHHISSLQTNRALALKDKGQVTCSSLFVLYNILGILQQLWREAFDCPFKTAKSKVIDLL